MLDEKDLQAIAQLMDVKLSQQKQEIFGEIAQQMANQKQEIFGEMAIQLSQQKQEIIQTVNVVIENKVQTQLNLLREGQQLILDKLVSHNDVERIESRVDTLEAVAKQHSREIAELKKAQ